MKILFLSLYPPLPQIDGGRIRTLNILKEVATSHDVTLLCFEDPLSQTDDHDKLKEICKSLIIINKPLVKKRSLMVKLLSLIQKEPISLSEYKSLEMQIAIKSLLSSNTYNLVHVDHLMLAQYHNNRFGLKWILTHHNIENRAQYLQISMRDNKSSFHKWRAILDHRRLYNYEINTSRKFDGLVTVSELEADYFSKLVPGLPIFVVPNGVDTKYFQQNRKEEEGLELLFTGRMDYAPNVDAMLWFCSDIFPKVQDEKPDVKLTIVGRSPTSDIMKLKFLPNVSVTGTVPDVRPYFQRSSIFVTPIRFGGGTRLKILEAMAMGVPVISTSFGCEGLNFRHGEELLIANDSDTFVKMIISLAEDPNFQKRLSEKAITKVREKYDWDIIGKTQKSVYASII